MARKRSTSRTATTAAERRGPRDEPTLVDADEAAGADDTDRHRPALPTGTCVGRYIITDVIGHGGMGSVYKAYDPELDRAIALKLLHVERGDDATRVRRAARLLREAQALAQLSHPNVVTVYDVGPWGHDIFIAMELVRGKTLGEWLRTRPGARKIVEVMVAAGEGLAAAHRAGIIHRDFKPDNVIVGDDARVRVLDFGVARAAALDTETGLPEVEATYETGEQLTDSERVIGGRLSDAGRLTEVGSVVGTPAYMAPEQLAGQEVDERADQFAFCVTLYEALHGERPFHGSRDALYAAIMRGSLPPVPAGKRVSAWTRRVLGTGLAAEPDERYRSMDELLVDLQRNPGTTWRRVGIAAALLTLAGLGILGLLRGESRPGLCQSAEEHLQGVWSPAVRGDIEQAFAATGAPHAADTFRRVADALDRYTSEWTATHTAACQATHVDGTQSQALLDLRMACLDRRVDQVRELTELYRSADVALLDRAAQAALSLPTLDGCSDADALTAVVPPPQDEDTRARVDQLRSTLARARALETAGRFDEALPLARQARDGALATGYAPVIAEAMYRMGSLHDDLGEVGAAEDSWMRAAHHASAARDEVLATEAWAELVWSVGYRQSRFDEAEILAQVALAHLARVGDAPLLEAHVTGTIGVVAIMRGKYQEARRRLERALALREQALGPTHYAIARSLDALGVVAEYEGELVEALAHAERALDIRERALGPNHPDVSFSLTNLAEGLIVRGDFERARQYAERALDIRERVLGPRHPDTGVSLLTLGSIAHGEGRLREALALHLRAQEIFAGGELVETTTALRRLSVLYLDLHEWRLALDVTTRTLAAYEEKAGESHPHLTGVLAERAEAHLGLGQVSRARQDAERALAIAESGEVSTAARAQARFTLAHALTAARVETARALELARAARQLLGDGTTHEERRLRTEIDDWLMRHDAAGRRHDAAGRRDPAP